MSDVLTPEQRRRCMAAIRSKDTKPELIVRRLCHAMGYRYRVHHKGLPGRPDLVFTRHRKLIFVHGCFWHRHNCRFGRVMPATRTKFWTAKFEANRCRDRRIRGELHAKGWRVLVVWECQLRRQDAILGKICRFLSEQPELLRSVPH